MDPRTVARPQGKRHSACAHLPVSLLLRLLATDGREAALSAAIIEHALTCWQ